MSWVTSLRATQIRHVMETQGPWQLSLFDETGLTEMACPDYPGERLVVCRNPLLAEERARKRAELLSATERELDKIVAATGRKRAPLRGEAAIGLRVGKVIQRFKMAKHFELTFTDETSPMPAKTLRSKPKRHWTASTCYGPTPRRRSFRPLRQWRPTSASAT